MTSATIKKIRITYSSRIMLSSSTTTRIVGTDSKNTTTKDRKNDQQETTPCDRQEAKIRRILLLSPAVSSGADEPTPITALSWVTTDVVYFYPHYDLFIDAHFQVIPFSVPCIISQPTEDPIEILRHYQRHGRHGQPPLDPSYVFQDLSSFEIVTHTDVRVVSTTKFVESYGHIHDVLFNLVWMVQTLETHPERGGCESNGGGTIPFRAVWNSVRRPPTCPSLVSSLFSRFSQQFLDYHVFDGDHPNPKKLHKFTHGGVFFRNFVHDSMQFHRFPERIVHELVSRVLHDTEHAATASGTILPSPSIATLFVARREGWSDTRMMKNFSALLSTMTERNIPILYPEDLSYEDLIRSLQTVRKAILLPWGSGLTNLIFVPKEVHVLIYYHHSYGLEYQSTIFQHVLAGRTFRIFFSDKEGNLDPAPLHHALDIIHRPPCSRDDETASDTSS